MIGELVASVCVNTRNLDILKAIADSCTNLQRLEFEGYSTFGERKAMVDFINLRRLELETYFTRRVLPFRNLNGLKVGDYVCLSTDSWKNCLAINPEIEHLEYRDTGDNKCIPLLEMLTKWKSLMITFWH